MEGIKLMSQKHVPDSTPKWTEGSNRESMMRYFKACLYHIDAKDIFWPYDNDESIDTWAESRSGAQSSVDEYDFSAISDYLDKSLELLDVDADTWFTNSEGHMYSDAELSDNANTLSSKVLLRRRNVQKELHSVMPMNLLFDEFFPLEDRQISWWIANVMNSLRTDPEKLNKSAYSVIFSSFIKIFGMQAIPGDCTQNSIAYKKHVKSMPDLIIRRYNEVGFLKETFAKPILVAVVVVKEDEKPVRSKGPDVEMKDAVTMETRDADQSQNHQDENAESDAINVSVSDTDNSSVSETKSSVSDTDNSSGSDTDNSSVSETKSSDYNDIPSVSEMKSDCTDNSSVSDTDISSVSETKSSVSDYTDNSSVSDNAKSSAVTDNAKSSISDADISSVSDTDISSVSETKSSAVTDTARSSVSDNVKSSASKTKSSVSDNAKSSTDTGKSSVSKTKSSASKTKSSASGAKSSVSDTAKSSASDSAKSFLSGSKSSVSDSAKSSVSDTAKSSASNATKSSPQQYDRFFSSKSSRTVPSRARALSDSERQFYFTFVTQLLGDVTANFKEYTPGLEYTLPDRSRIGIGVVGYKVVFVNFISNKDADFHLVPMTPGAVMDIFVSQPLDMLKKDDRVRLHKVLLYLAMEKKRVYWHHEC